MIYVALGFGVVCGFILGLMSAAISDEVRRQKDNANRVNLYTKMRGWGSDQ